MRKENLRVKDVSVVPLCKLCIASFLGWFPSSVVRGSVFVVSVRFFPRFFFCSFCTVFVGNYDFSLQGVPNASCIANFSGFGSECGRKRY